MSRNRDITKKDCINNAMTYNKYLTKEYLLALPFIQMIKFCHPSFREEVKELGYIIN